MNFKKTGPAALTPQLVFKLYCIIDTTHVIMRGLVRLDLFSYVKIWRELKQLGQNFATNRFLIYWNNY